MVSRRSRGRAKPPKKPREEEDEEGEPNKPEEEEEKSDGKRAEYEESRAQRIKENSERMKSLGIFDLSKKLKSASSKPSSSLTQRKSKPVSTPSIDPPRRSSRLKVIPRVSYSEKIPKTEKLVENVEICIPKGENSEFYTVEHEDLLGDSKAVWDLYADGFDEDGQRIYDPVQGKTCHQCRQKTVGQLTECSKCQMSNGHFCGDCLYMRYGENIIEVNQNLDWICPVCRGICNCSRCRRAKGWAPTGAIYNKVVKLGFKSVAHYLIYTFRGQANMEVAAAENPVSVAEPETDPVDGEEESPDALTATPFGGKEKETNEGDMKLDSDEEYGEESSEDGGNVGSDTDSASG